MSRPRLLLRFSAAGGGLAVEFPPAAYEWESSQSLRGATEPAVGADYAVDLLESRPAPKAVATERVRGLIVARDGAALNVEMDRLRSRLYRIGRGRLWAVDAAGNERWAWARLDSMPDITLTVEHRRHAPVILSFLRLSDWYAAEPVVIQQRVTSPTLNLAITNPGEATARQITVTLRSRTVAGFSQPTITNELTGETCGTSRVAGGATHVWRLDAGRLAVEYSTDGGTTWASDYANLITGPLQVGFLRVEPGTNPLTITSQGSPDYDLEIRFYPAWH